MLKNSVHAIFQSGPPDAALLAALAPTRQGTECLRSDESISARYRVDLERWPEMALCHWYFGSKFYREES